MCFGRGFAFGGLMLLCWATVAIVVAALTTWWVLLALLPLLMMMSGMAMMGTMARSAGGDPRAGPWGRCSAWFTPTRKEEVGSVRGGLDSRREERRETPTEILERRFAEGAISPEEYNKRREIIARASR